MQKGAGTSAAIGGVVPIGVISADALRHDRPAAADGTVAVISAPVGVPRQHPAPPHPPLPVPTMRKPQPARWSTGSRNTIVPAARCA